MRILTVRFAHAGMLLAFETERRIVGEDGSYTHHYRVRIGTKTVHPQKIVVTGYFGLFPFPGGEFSVSTHGCVDYHIRTHTVTLHTRRRRRIIEKRIDRNVLDLFINVYTNTDVGVFAVNGFVSHAGPNDNGLA